MIEDFKIFKLDDLIDSELKSEVNFVFEELGKPNGKLGATTNGIIYNLVNEKFRAWHAGESFWQDVVDINSFSIGIELDYSPSGKNNKFSSKIII